MADTPTSIPDGLPDPHGEGVYRVLNGVLCIKRGGRWVPYPGMCQGCRYPGDEHGERCEKRER